MNKRWHRTRAPRQLSAGTPSQKLQKGFGFSSHNVTGQRRSCATWAPSKCWQPPGNPGSPPRPPDNGSDPAQENKGALHTQQTCLHTQGYLWSATEQQRLQLKNTKCIKLNLPQLDFLTWPRLPLSCSVLHPASNISRPAPPSRFGPNFSSVFWQEVLACLSPLRRRRDSWSCTAQPWAALAEGRTALCTLHILWDCTRGANTLPWLWQGHS